MGTRRGVAGDPVARGVGVVAPPRGVSPAKRDSGGAGAGLSPLSSRREVPMNFATLNKKWFHEVNISVTIPSPTRDAHAQTHARTHRHDTTRHDEPDRTDVCYVYIYILTCIRTRDTHAYKRPHILVHSLILARSPALPLESSLFFARRAALRRTSRGPPHEHVRTRTHARASGRYTRSC